MHGQAHVQHSRAEKNAVNKNQHITSSWLHLCFLLTCSEFLMKREQLVAKNEHLQMNPHKKLKSMQDMHTCEAKFYPMSFKFTSHVDHSAFSSTQNDAVMNNTCVQLSTWLISEHTFSNCSLQFSLSVNYFQLGWRCIFAVNKKLSNYRLQ